MLRKFIVKHFALYYHFKVFGKTVTALRCTRIGGPLFLITGAVIGLDGGWPLLQWYDIFLLSLLVIYAWLTFDWFGVGYFALWPVKREELDAEQQHDYDFFMANNK